jgi:hypothetical protein
MRIQCLLKKTNFVYFQDMTEEQLKRKENLCRENLELIYKLDPHMIRYLDNPMIKYLDPHMIRYLDPPMIMYLDHQKTRYLDPHIAFLDI